MAEDFEANLREWGKRTIGYARSLTLAGRTGTVVREETEQSALTGADMARRLWEETEAEVGMAPFGPFASAFIRKVICWASDHLRPQ